MKTDHLAKERSAILKRAIRNAAFDGWDNKALERAALDAGYEASMARRAFPGGARELLEAYIAAADERMIADCKKLDLENMKIRDRITAIIRARLEGAAGDREAIRRALAHQLLPLNGPRAARSLMRTADHIWRLAGDTSTDFNWYSKRLSVATVYSAVLLYWLNDESEDNKDSWKFLDRRIKGVMRIFKARAKMEKRLAKLPNPWAIAGRLRHREADQAGA